MLQSCSNGCLTDSGMSVIDNMKQSVIQKTVDQANAAALATYESGVASIATSIQNARKAIAVAEKTFTEQVAQQATYIAQQQAALAKLTPPPTITAVEIFGKEVIEAATE